VITVVGIGADGWPGLAESVREVLRAAPCVMGSVRQLGLLSPDAVPADRRELLPSPLLPALDGLAARDGLCLLASGDPMLHGIGATLARRLPLSALRVLPAVSSSSLAAARLGWPLADATVLSLVTAPASSLAAELEPGRRLLVLARDRATVAEAAAVLRDRGWGPSRVAVCDNLGAADETVRTCLARDLAGTEGSDLVVLGIECRPDSGTPVLPRLPGLPDGAFDSDGALTRREVRTLVLAALRPAGSELLWDIGAGTGSISIEWLRAAAGSRAIAVEPRAGRAERIAANAAQLGVPRLRVVVGSAPAALVALPAPDAVFVGGGLTAPGVVEACWQALPSGGRLVATAVTVESEALLHAWQGRVGGTLTRLALSRAAPLGGLTAWRPELPVVVWEALRGASP